MLTFDEKILSSKCRELLKSYDDVFKFFYEELVKETNATPIKGTDAFSIAQEYTRREGIREGLRLFIKKIEKNANVRDE